MISQPVSFTVPSDLHGMRLDAALFVLQQGIVPNPLSRTQYAHLISEGAVSVNGQLVKKASHKALEGMHVTVVMPAPEPATLLHDPQVQFQISYEDDDLLVINKPAGLVVHPGAGAREGTLAHGLVAKCATVENPEVALRPGIVHRLDKDTSGLMVVAKHDAALHALQRQFLPPRTVHRHYLALTVKRPSRAEQGTIDLPLGRHPVARTKMAVRERHGRRAVTHWQIAAPLRDGFLIALTLETGRTHQIRVHLSAKGAPILGDHVYGTRETRTIDKKYKADRQMLHATAISLIHPVTANELHFAVEPPEDFKESASLLNGGEEVPWAKILEVLSR